jgi:hypothetical protein
MAARHAILAALVLVAWPAFAMHHMIYRGTNWQETAEEPNNYFLGGISGRNVIAGGTIDNEMIANGNATFMLGLLGDDIMNPGIVPPGFRSNVYGGCSKPGFHPPAATTGQGKFCGKGDEGLDWDGNDELHGGARVWLLPGSTAKPKKGCPKNLPHPNSGSTIPQADPKCVPGHNMLQIHGPAPMSLRNVIGWRGEPENPVVTMDLTYDQLIVDRSDTAKAPAGFEIVDIKYVQQSGRAEILTVFLRAWSINPTVREQFVEIRINDDGRGVHHPVRLPGAGTGKAYWLAKVDAYFHANVGRFIN